MSKIEDVYDDISAVYSDLQTLYRKVRAKKAENVDSNRTTISNSLVKHEGVLTGISNHLRD